MVGVLSFCLHHKCRFVDCGDIKQRHSPWEFSDAGRSGDLSLFSCDFCSVFDFGAREGTESADLRSDICRSKTAGKSATAGVTETDGVVGSVVGGSTVVTVVLATCDDDEPVDNIVGAGVSPENPRRPEFTSDK